VRRACGACLVFALTACSLLGGGGPVATVTIGVDLPLSGAEGRVGTPALNGVRLYVQQHPTIDGFAVSLAVRDDSIGGSPVPPLGAANVQGLAGDPQVIAVIGPLDSSVARAEIPIANQAALAIVSPATSSPCLTRDVYLPAGLNPPHTPITCKDAGLPSPGDLRPSGVNNYFRMSTTDDLQGPAAADYAYNTLHLLRVATISDHEAYGQMLAGSFATRFQAQGGSIVGRLDLDPSAAADTTAFLKRMKADGAQGVYFGGVTANKACVMRSEMAAVFDLGEAAPFLGGDGIAEDPACVRDAGVNVSGIYATVPIIDTSTLGTAEPVIAAFKAMFPNPHDYGTYTVAAYDAAAVVYEALDRAIRAAGGQLPARGNVISQLSAIQDFEGATGQFDFDVNGDSTRRVITIFEPSAADPTGPWRRVGAVDYTTALPY